MGITVFFPVLMREPVLEEKKHVVFCKYANQLLERVTGKVPNPMMDLSLSDVRRVMHLPLHSSSHPVESQYSSQ